MFLKQDYDIILLMVDRLRGIPQRVESFRREHPLRPPTKADMLFYGAEATYGVGIAAGAVYKNVTGHLPPAFDLWLGAGIVGNGMYLLDRGMERVKKWSLQRTRRVPS